VAFDPPPWAPAPCAWADLISREALAAEVAANAWTPSQRRAMRLLLEHIRRGDYEIWEVSRHAWESLPDTLALVIHTRTSEEIREALEHADAEIRAEEADKQRARRGRRASSMRARGGSAADGRDTQQPEMVVIS
jgi:hypothetical protein